MPSRLYLPSGGTAGASPTISADWEHSSGIRRPMSTTKGTTALTSTAYTPDGADHLVSGDALHVQFVSGPLLAQTIAAQSVSLSVKGLVAHVNNAQSLTWKLFVWTAAGAVGSTILAIRRSAGAFPTSLINRADTATTTSVTVGAGDRLVLEIGLGGTPTAAGGVQGHNGTLRWGENGATDAPLNGSSTSTTENPWLEFTDTLLFPPETTGAVSLRARAWAIVPSTARRALVTWVSLSVPDTSELAAAVSLRTGARVAAATRKDSSASVAARVTSRGTITPLLLQATSGTVSLRVADGAAVTAGKATSASISARSTGRGAVVGQKARSLSVALRVGAWVTTSVTSASTATAALAGHVRLTGTAAAHATTTSIAARVAARSSIYFGKLPSFAALRVAARVTATAAAAAHTAVATAQSHIRAALAGTAARVSASAGRTSQRLQAPSYTRASLTTTAARTTAGGQSTGEAYIPKASLGVVTIGGTAAAAAPTTLTDRLGLADLFGAASVTTLIAPRVALGEVHLQTALRAQSDGLSEFTLYWPPALLLQPVHLGWTYRGDTITLPVWQAIDQRGNLLNLEGATVWFTAKADLADTDAEPLTIQCSTLIGGVVIIDPALGSYQVTIPPAETQQLADDTVFTFDVQVNTVTPSTHTVRRGTLGVVQDVTRVMA